MRLFKFSCSFAPASREVAAPRSTSWVSSTNAMLVFTLIAGLALAGCGQGGSSADDEGTGQGDTGSVSVFLTDAPADDFDRILLDIEGITLIGGGPQVTIFTGSETVDLLDLENFSDLFVHADDVPAREYKKIRLNVSRIRLVKEGDDGEVIEIDPPANGKIDLLAPQGFTVHAGVDCVIEIDLDARESIDRNGNGRYRFRPVVKFEIRDTLPPRKLARVHGTIRRVFDDESFVLCPTLFMASRDLLESREREPEGGLGDRRRCMTVELGNRTGVFDRDGMPAPADELEAGDRVTVVGRFHLVDRMHDERDDVDPMADEDDGELAEAAAFRIDDDFEHRRHRFDGEDQDDEGENEADDDESDDDADRDRERRHPMPVRLVLLAFVIEEGPPGTFLRLKGTVLSELGDDDEFDFGIAPGQGFGSQSETRALVQEGTRLFSRRGFEVRPGALMPDVQALIDGVFQFEAGGASLLRTALIMLNIERPMPDVLRGEIEDIVPAQRRLFLAVEESVDNREACVDVLEDARIVIIRENTAETASSNATFEDLEVGMNVRAYGAYGENDCLQARNVVAFDDGPIICGGFPGRQCPDGMLCQYRAGECNIADNTGVCVDDPGGCPEIYDPVCGCDGETYGNRCEALKAGARVDHEGRCEPKRCGGIAGFQCDEGEICVFESGECIIDAMGVCEPAPLGCPRIWAPVCGCDGETYGNECEARRAEVTILHRGECEDDRRCGGELDVACSEGHFCRAEVGDCSENAPGQCTRRPEICPDVWMPVCGCDGQTYGNSCEALAAGISVERVGPCEDPCDRTDAQRPDYCDPIEVEQMNTLEVSATTM